MLVGILTGTSIHYAFSFVLSVLDLDGRAEKQRGRTLSMYRAEKQRRLEEKDPLMKLQRKSGWSIEAGALRRGLGDREKPKGNRGRSGSRLVPNTILEEDSIEDGSSE